MLNDFHKSSAIYNVNMLKEITLWQKKYFSPSFAYS